MVPFRSNTPGLSVALLSLVSLVSSCGNSGRYTFAKDIAPMIHRNCSPCHRPEGGAPFSLLTYNDVASRSRMITYVTQKGFMPPWPADTHFSRFINERTLSRADKLKIQEWHRSGCPQGDMKQFKPYRHTRESVLGKPDLELKVTPVVIQGNNRDKFYAVKVPIKLLQGKFVRAVEFVPGKPDLVHHVNGHYLRFSDATDALAGSRIADIESDGFLKEFEALKLLNRDGSLPERVHSAVNYLPGAFGVSYPKGIGGFFLGSAGAFVLNDIHYGPSRKQTVDSSRLFVYYADAAPQRPTFEVMMGTNGVVPVQPPLQVPAGRISRHSSRMTIYSDISVLTVNPHMHLIGKSFKAYALKPNGDTVKLIHIPSWQFRWQYFYTFKNPLRIPRGSTIVVEAVFDNTARNPNNPNNPPRPIGERLDRGGASMRTTDEMLQFIITYMPYMKGDETIDLSKP